jgi:hypothetical protein
MADLIKPLFEVFANRVFFVPDYQRGYAWGEKQWNDLTKDLELLPDSRKHYTGTLVIRTSSGKGSITDEEGRVYHPFDVIDGQQRLTTCILFLKAIYAEMLSLPEYRALANGLREMYLSNLDLNGQPFTKLTLNRDCRDFFSNNILGFSPDVKGASIRAHKNLENGKVHFSEYLRTKREALGAGYPAWLRQLYFKLTQSISLIVYEVDNELDAGVIFETMNDRGIELTELEKVKNYLLYVSSKLHLPDQQGLQELNERINSTWAHIFEELMSAGISDKDSEDQLLRAHWLTVYDYAPQNWKNSRSVKDKFSLEKYQGNHPVLLRDLLGYLDTLRNAATAYCDLRNPLRSGAFNDIQDESRRVQIIEISENLARLNPARLGARASFQPILIAVRLRAPDDGLTYLETVELCERFDFRVYQWMRRQPRAGQTQLFRLGYDYFKNPNAQVLVDSLKQNIFIYCSDAQFVQSFANETADWYRWDGLKYFLYEYERYKAERARKPVLMPWEFLRRSKKEDTIEHILPQTPDKPYWLERFDEAARKRWTHDIGNLTLTYDNSPLSRRPFRTGELGEDKVSFYANSKLFIEQELKDVEHWTVDEITRRREGIKDWAVKRWYVEPAQNTLTPSLDESSTMDVVLARADMMGVRPEIDDLLELIKQYDFHTRAYPSCIMCAPSFKKIQGLFTVWMRNPGYLSVGVWHESVVGLFHVPLDEAKAILGARDQYLSTSEFSGFLERLETLFIRLTTQK